MPRRSRAIFMIGMIFAFCEISMSDLGVWCCEAGMGRSFGAMGSAEARAGGEICTLDEVRCADLPAIGGFHAQHSDAAVGADHGEAVIADVDDFADLAGDAFRVLGGEGLRLKDLYGLAFDGGPGAGRRVAAPDQIVGLTPRLAPIDFRV